MFLPLDCITKYPLIFNGNIGSLVEEGTHYGTL